MQLPNVVHPNTFTIGAVKIRVVAYFDLTEQQAAAIAMHAYRSRKWTKKDAQKLHIQYWTGDQEALAMLSAPRPQPW